MAALSNPYEVPRNLSIQKGFGDLTFWDIRKIFSQPQQLFRLKVR